jgi:hypothetical protein
MFPKKIPLNRTFCVLKGGCHARADVHVHRAADHAVGADTATAGSFVVITHVPHVAHDMPYSDPDSQAGGSR